MDVTVIVDGGASNCRLVALDSNGSTLASSSTGPASLSVGEELAWQSILSGLTAIGLELRQDENWLPDRLVMGLAGSLQQSRRERFLKLIPNDVAVVLFTDGHAQLMGACNGQPGICLAVGTGSVLHWMDTDFEVHHVGGWGFPAGDEGSGAWLGLRMINAFINHRDDLVAETVSTNKPILFDLLQEKIGNESSDIQLWSTLKISTDFASLMPILVAAVEQQDPVALDLQLLGANECLKLINRAPADLPVSIAGGLASFYNPILTKTLGKRLVEPAGSSIDGLKSLIHPD